MTTEQFDIFISHNNLDKQLIDPIVQRLYDEFDIRSWLDKWDLHAATDWEPAIRQALESCRMCAVVLGANGWGPHHLREARLSLERRASDPEYRVIPVLLPGADQEAMGVLEDFFQRTHRVDFSNGPSDEEAFRRLLAAVRVEAPGPPPLTVFGINRGARQWEQVAEADKASILYRGGELRDAQAIAVTHTGMLSNAAVRFLSASAEAEQHAIQAERSRTRKIIASLIVGLVIVAATAVFALAKRSDALKSANLAEQRRQDAETQKGIAEEQRGIAEQKQQYAETQKGIADQETKHALASAKAEREANEKAEERRIEAEHQRLVATKQRDLALARSLAVQSQQLEDDRTDELRALLARQAYLFNQRANGSQSEIDRSLRILHHISYPNYFIGAQESDVYALTFNPSSNILVSGGYSGDIVIWNLKNRGAVPTVLGHVSGSVTSLAISSNDRTLALTDDSGVLTMYNLDNPGSRPTIVGQGGVSLSAVTFGSGDLLAVGGINGEVKIWNLSKPDTEPVPLVGFKEEITSIKFNADNTSLGVGGISGTVTYWHLQSPSVAHTLGHQSQRIKGLAFSKDNTQLISASMDGTVMISGMQPDSVPKILNSHIAQVLSADLSADGRRLAFYNPNEGLHLWEFADGKEPVLLTKDRGDSFAVAFSPDGQILAFGRHSGTRIYEMHPSNDVQSVIGSSATTNGDYEFVALGPDGRTLALAETGRVILRRDNAQDVFLKTGNENEYSFLSFSPDGKQLAVMETQANQGSVVNVWSVDNPNAQPELIKGTGDKISWIKRRIPKGGSGISAEGEWTLRATQHVNQHSLPTIIDGVAVVLHAFNSDGTVLAVVKEDGEILLKDLRKPTSRPLPLRGYGGPFEGGVEAITFSPDDSKLAVSINDGFVRIWDLKHPEGLPIVLAGDPYGQIGVVKYLAFSTDNQFLATIANGGPIVVWKVQTKSLADLACQKTWRNLTLDEWKDFVGAGLPYQNTCPK